MRTPEWYRKKADAYRAGWRANFGVDPTDANVALGLAVAVHESYAGDSSVATHNWGSTQRRVPNAAEKKVLAEAGLSPNLPNVEKGRAALAAAGLIDPDAELYIDSNPGQGYYWVFFWAFPTDEAGATFYIKVLAKDRASCRAVLERTGTPHELAAAMYNRGNRGYFTGFYVKDRWYAKSGTRYSEVPAGAAGAVLGADLNVSAYASAISRHLSPIKAALSAQPSTPPLRPTIRRGSRGDAVVEWQKIIGVTADGIFGPKTEAATIHWQQSHHLDPDGIVGPKTWNAALSP